MTQEIKNKLIALSKAADETSRLSAEQLSIIHKEKWFKLFVPEEYGGLALNLPEALELEETLAAIDGSLGWTITLCSGATQFIGYLPCELSAQIFKDEEVCFGGSGAITGAAVETENGYIINGYWKYATGAPYCTHFTANCRIEANGKPLLNKDGEPVYLSFLFMKDEVTLHYEWNTMGLKATASDSFSVADLEVPKQRAFVIDAQYASLPGLIYQYPFLQFAETTLAANISGMALHFLDEAGKLFNQWNQSGKYEREIIERLQSIQKSNNDQLQHKREQFYDAVELSWKLLENKGSISQEILQQVSSVSKELSRVSRQVVAELYPHCGVAATQNGMLLNQIFRDVFTASQHYLLNMK